MLSPRYTSRQGFRVLAWISGLTLLLVLMFPMRVQAAPPQQGYEGPEKCAECHYAVTQEWIDSGHAQALMDAESSLQLACAGEGGFVDCACLECHTTAFDAVQGTYAHSGVTCESCHGAYVEDHPVNGPMVLTSDSTLCQSCHVETHGQWSSSPHGDAHINCASCHQVHSQDLRLEDEALCDSCHRDEHLGPVHTAHVGKGVECVDCHLSHEYDFESLEGEDAMVMAAVDRPTLASHTFAVDSTEACLSCHVEESAGLQQVVYSDAVSKRASELALELDQAREENRSLKTVSVVALGAGLGIGVLMGAILVLAVGFVCKGRS